MIERLQRALEHIEELSPAAQEDLAVQIEEMTEPIEEFPQASHLSDDERLPKSVRNALAVFGAWRDLQDDDEFEALDRIRHSVPPTPPIDLDDL
ncbi:MAG TPA: hypothetical protein VKT52_07175 [Ktedonobacterales bacterium]|nr:hypothetical protein [Ktedonobacterales bacterium]